MRDGAHIKSTMFHQFQYDEFRHHHVGHWSSQCFRCKDWSRNSEVYYKACSWKTSDSWPTWSSSHHLCEASHVTSFFHVGSLNTGDTSSVLSVHSLKILNKVKCLGEFFFMYRHRTKAEEDTTCSKTWLEVLFVQTIASIFAKENILPTSEV